MTLNHSSISRRQFGAATCGIFASAVFSEACFAGQLAGDGRLTARPKSHTKTVTAGIRALRLGDSRDAFLQVPPSTAKTPMPLVVMLHGAGGSGERFLRRFGTVADARGIALLSPDSRSSTWDAIRGGFGPDVGFVNQALQTVFDMIPIDRARVAVGGFSDGATYALSLGLINGDLFSRILAFSPGFVVPGEWRDHPRILVSHGTNDQILPIDRCSRVIVPDLRRRGYDVTFREFEGGHEVPPAIVEEGLGAL